MIVHMYGAVPPRTPIVPLYATPTVAAAGEVSTRVTAAALTVATMLPVVEMVVAEESDTLTVSG